MPITIFSSVSYTHLDVYKRQSLETANYPKNWTNTPGGNGAGSWERGGIFYGCSSMKSITIPEGITSVVPYAFQGCAYIKQVELPDSLISIGEYAFEGCSGLTEIKLPASVRTIGWNAYGGCTGAVSYTHLDVYKRQGERLFINSVTVEQYKKYISLMEKNDTEKFSGVMFFNKKIMQEMFGNELSLAAVGEIDAVEFLTAIKTVHFIMQNIVAEKMLNIVEVEQVEKEASAFDDYDRENGYEDEDEQPEEKMCIRDR